MPRQPLRIGKRDQEIGQRVREQRLAKGLSQTELGRLIGVTFQQVQKYENGANRIGAGRLVRIADALETPAHTFFGEATQRVPDGTRPIDELKIEGAERLLRAFERIADNNARHALLRIAEHLTEK
jgi:transcriptional regulator with XRE-family HTH domain